MFPANVVARTGLLRQGTRGTLVRAFNYWKPPISSQVISKTYISSALVSVKRSPLTPVFFDFNAEELRPTQNRDCIQKTSLRCNVYVRIRLKPDLMHINGAVDAIRSKDTHVECGVSGPANRREKIGKIHIMEHAGIAKTPRKSRMFILPAKG